MEQFPQQGGRGKIEALQGVRDGWRRGSRVVSVSVPLLQKPCFDNVLTGEGFNQTSGWMENQYRCVKVSMSGAMAWRQRVSSSGVMRGSFSCTAWIRLSIQ